MYPIQAPRGLAYRRHRREVMVARAFEMRFYSWGEHRDWVGHPNGYNYIKIIGADKWALQDQNRKRTHDWAVRIADRMRVCSCWMCSWHDPDVRNARAKAEFRDAAEDLFGDRE